MLATPACYAWLVGARFRSNIRISHVSFSLRMSKLTCNTSLSLAKTTWQLYVARQYGAQVEKPPFLKTRLAQAHEIFTGRLGQGLSGAGFGPARLWNTPWVTQFGLGLWSPSLVWASGSWPTPGRPACLASPFPSLPFASSGASFPSSGVLHPLGSRGRHPPSSA